MMCPAASCSVTHSDGVEDGQSLRSGLLVLAVWVGPDGRLLARLRMTRDVAAPEETLVTTASRHETLEEVRAFLDSFADLET